MHTFHRIFRQRPRKGASLSSLQRPHSSQLAHSVANILPTDSALQTHYKVTGIYQMIGTVPETGKTTTIAAPIVPVSLDLRNADGSPRFVKGHRLFSDATQFVKRVLESPLFVNAHYSSSQRATQFVDAVQRAEFFNRARNNAWHTILKPSVKKARVMVLRAGTYQFALHKDGTCCAYVLVDFDTFNSKLMPSSSSDTKSPVGAAEHAGDIKPGDVSTFLFPNTFLFVGSQ